MNRLRRCLYLGVGLLGVLILVLHLLTHEPEAGGFMEIPGVMAVIGFLGCLLLTVVAKFVGHHLLERDEDYYHRGKDDLP